MCQSSLFIFNYDTSFLILHKNNFIMNEISLTVAKQLLDIKAIRLQPTNPFTWASGWKSPIYCDNRKALSYSAARTYIKESFAKIAKEKYADFDVVAGVATGAIAQGVLVAEELQLPYCYVRPKPKDHGMGNQIEGTIPEGSKVIVVEDLISTGGSSLKAVDALRAAGYDVIGMVASYTYGFPVAEEAFKAAGVKLITICDYDATTEIAAEIGYISKEDIEVLKEWRQSPSTWKQ